MKNFKTLLIASAFCLGITLISCGKSCKECTGGTLPDTTLCEKDFQTTSDYNDLVQNYESNGSTCKNK